MCFITPKWCKTASYVMLLSAVVCCSASRTPSLRKLFTITLTFITWSYAREIKRYTSIHQHMRIILHQYQPNHPSTQLPNTNTQYNT